MEEMAALAAVAASAPPTTPAVTLEMRPMSALAITLEMRPMSALAMAASATSMMRSHLLLRVKSFIDRSLNLPGVRPGQGLTRPASAVADFCDEVVLGHRCLHIGTNGSAVPQPHLAGV